MDITPYDVSMDNIEDYIKNSDSTVTDIIRSFNDGWAARGKHDLEQYSSRLRANVLNTVSYIIEVFKFCVEIDIRPTSAFVKIIDPKSMAVVLAVTLDDYLKRELLKIHGKTIDIEQSSRSDDYNVSFSIVCDYGSLNEESLNCDRFTKIELPDFEQFKEESRTS